MKNFLQLIWIIALSAVVSSRAGAQTKAEITNAQAVLKELGYYNGKIDGLWGVRTSNAVKSFQDDNALPATERMDSSTYNEIKRHGGHAVLVSWQALHECDAYREQVVRCRLEQKAGVWNPLDKQCGQDIGIGTFLKVPKGEQAEFCGYALSDCEVWVTKRGIEIKDKSQLYAPQGAVPLLEALAEGYAEAEVAGSSIQYVTLRIRKKAKGTLKVNIPAGTYFVCRGNAQNMVSRTTETLTLQSENPVSVSIEAACANKPRDIPGYSDRFDIAQSPHQKELALLMPVLHNAGASYLTVQAAVWIVTDNADYSELGTLRLGSSRAIGVDNTVQAMWYCEQAGIDITKKRVWFDRNFLTKNVSTGKLKNWLVKR